MICTQCLVDKETSDFPKRTDSKTGRRSVCKICYNKTKRIEWKKRSTKESNLKDNIRSNKYYNTNISYVNTIKKESGCINCGEKDPRCLDFHHLDKNSKISGVGRMMRGSRKHIDNEIKKCVVICCNCHNEEHLKKQEEKRKQKDTIKSRFILKRQLLIRQKKSEIGCKECGNNNPFHLHFHHVNKEDKYSCVGKMVSSGLSWEKIEVEISKCEVVCGNCHRKHHITHTPLPDFLPVS